MMERECEKEIDYLWGLNFYEFYVSTTQRVWVYCRQSVFYILFLLNVSENEYLFVYVNFLFWWLQMYF